jgi:hypothetical protein
MSVQIERCPAEGKRCWALPLSCWSHKTLASNKSEVHICNTIRVQSSANGTQGVVRATDPR